MFFLNIFHFAEQVFLQPVALQTGSNDWTFDCVISPRVSTLLLPWRKADSLHIRRATVNLHAPDNGKDPSSQAWYDKDTTQCTRLTITSSLESGSLFRQVSSASPRTTSSSSTVNWFRFHKLFKPATAETASWTEGRTPRFDVSPIAKGWIFCPVDTSSVDIWGASAVRLYGPSTSKITRSRPKVKWIIVGGLNVQ